MSHEISNVNGVNEIAFVGEKPWHGLGQELQANASIEEWQAKSMPFKIHRSKVRYVTERGSNVLDKVTTTHEWPEKHVLFRSDTLAPIGMVSAAYKVVQPVAVLEFFRDLIASQDFTMDVAGTLRGGAVYWALARINSEAMVGSGDKMVGHVLLSTSADGSRATECANVATRVVCANTLRMSDGEQGKRIRVSHRLVFDAEAIKTQMGIARGAFQKFMEQARALSRRKMGTIEVNQYAVELLGNEELSTLDQMNEILAGRHAQAILSRYSGAGKGSQLATAKDTAWGLVNAVTEYVDHDYPARSDDNRLNSAWFGNGAALKQKAMALAMDMV